MANTRRPNSGKKAARAPSDPAPEEASPDEGLPTAAALPKRGGRRRLWAWLKLIFGLFLVLSLLGLLAFGVYRYALHTPRFAIRELKVQGLHRLSQEQIAAWAGVELGKNLLALDTEQAELGLKKSPWIQSALVSRQLPGIVRVELTENEPRALALIEGQSFLVSREGEPFKEYESGDPLDLSLITGITAFGLARDRRAEIERLARAIELLDAWDKLPLSKGYPMEEIHLDELGGTTLTVGTEGTTLVLGRPPYEQKLLRAVRVLTKSAQKGAQVGVIFLDNEAHPERVVLRVK